MTFPATSKNRVSLQEEAMAALDDEAFRVALRGVLARSGRSMRGLSAAMGRDPGYVAALLDPSRPSRARPNPADLLAASNATGIPFLELLAALWGIGTQSITSGSEATLRPPLAGLTDAELAEVEDFAAFVAARRGRHRRRAEPKQP